MSRKFNFNNVARNRESRKKFFLDQEREEPFLETFDLSLQRIFPRYEVAIQIVESKNRSCLKIETRNPFEKVFLICLTTIFDKITSIEATQEALSQWETEGGFCL